MATVRKNKLSIVFILAFLAVIVLSWIQNRPLTISDAIYAITGLIILWYSDETAMMRIEMTKQTKLQMRPVIILRLDRDAVFYKNDGTGPALNVRVTQFKPMILTKLLNNQTVYEIQPVPYIGQGKEAKMVIRSTNETGSIQDIPDMDMFFGVSRQVMVTILYRDIEGTKYESMIATNTGYINDILLKRNDA